MNNSTVFSFYVIFIGESDGLYLKNGQIFRRNDISKPPQCQLNVQYQVIATVTNSELEILHIKESTFDAFGAYAKISCLAGFIKTCREIFPPEIKDHPNISSILNNLLIQTFNDNRE